MQLHPNSIYRFLSIIFYNKKYIKSDKEKKEKGEKTKLLIELRASVGLYYCFSAYFDSYLFVSIKNKILIFKKNRKKGKRQNFMKFLFWKKKSFLFSEKKRKEKMRKINIKKSKKK